MKNKFYSKRRAVISCCKDVIIEIFNDFISKYINQFILLGVTSKQSGSIIITTVKTKKLLDTKAIFDSNKKILKLYLHIEKNSVYELLLTDVENLNCELSLIKLLVSIFSANLIKLLEEYKNLDDLDFTYSLIVEQTILKYISPENYQVSKKVLNTFKNWLSKTYEGNPVDFCIGIINDKKARILMMNFLIF